MPQHALLAHALVRDLGGRRVLDGVSLTASPGHRIGLIGENGVGKSTLLRLLAGADDPDAGRVTRPDDLGFLHQEMPFEVGTTVAAVLDEALREAREDLAELDRLAGELARVPEDDPRHQGVLDAYGRRLEQAPRTGSPGTPTGVPPWSWTVWASVPSTTTARWARSPAGSADGSPWPRCSSGGPPRCSWTSRPTTSTTAPPPSWRNRSARCPEPSCSPATTGRSSTPSART
ncbi:hypothetical protein GCM10010378_70130 [Streptomyces viridochromogenes]